MASVYFTCHTNICNIHYPKSCTEHRYIKRCIALHVFSNEVCSMYACHSLHVGISISPSHHTTQPLSLMHRCHTIREFVLGRKRGWIINDLRTLVCMFCIYIYICFMYALHVGICVGPSHHATASVSHAHMPHNPRVSLRQKERVWITAFDGPP